MFKPMTKAELDAHFSALLDAAYDAANAAQVGKVENMNALDCGFAWVEVLPGNHPFVSWCKRQIKAAELDSQARRYGSRHSTAWTFWKPGNFTGQSISIHKAGADAFRDALALDPAMGGARVISCSRYD